MTDSEATPADDRVRLRARKTLLPAALVLLVGESGCLYRKPWKDDALIAGPPPLLPSLPQGPALRIPVLGDSETGGKGQLEVSRAIAGTHASIPPHLVLTVGDGFHPRGGAGRDNAYRVEPTPVTLSAFSTGGWCFLPVWPDTLVAEGYNRIDGLRFRHLIARLDTG